MSLSGMFIHRINTTTVFYEIPRRILKKDIQRFFHISLLKMGKGKQLVEGKSTRLFEPCVIVHGGAWKLPCEWEENCLLGVQDAVKAGYRKLLQGGSAIDGVEAAVKSLEDNAVFNAGYGSVLTEDGTVEMDAMLMDGKTLNTGAISCLSNVSNPISVARLVMDKTPHCMLVSHGALKFAKKQNVPILEDSTVLISKYSKMKAEIFKAQNASFESMLAVSMNTEAAALNKQKNIQLMKERLSRQDMHDTVGAVAFDCHGNIACATSTGGLPWKMVGRVGDSPMVGSGGYANTVAGVSTTGHGESILKVVLAREVVRDVETGTSPMKACIRGVDMMFEKTEGQGGCICIDKDGNWGRGFSTCTMPWAALKAGVLSYGCHPDQIEKVHDVCE